MLIEAGEEKEMQDFKLRVSICTVNWLYTVWPNCRISHDRNVGVFSVLRMHTVPLRQVKRWRTFEVRQLQNSD